MSRLRFLGKLKSIVVNVSHMYTKGSNRNVSREEILRFFFSKYLTI